MKHLYLIIIGIALLSFTSCGRQQQAKSVVKEFMDRQLHKADISYLDFSDVDSTHAITDSLVQALRHRAPSGLQYEEPKGRSLIFIRAKYTEGDDTLSATFYMNSNPTGIVAFKDN